MAYRRLQHLPQRHDLVVQRAPRRRLVLHGNVLARGTRLARWRRRRPVHAIVLHLAGGDLGDAELAEEAAQMQPQTNAMTLDPAGAALPLREDRILLEGLVGR